MSEQAKKVKSAHRSSGTGWQSAMKSKPAPQTNVVISTKTRRRPHTKGSAVHPDTTSKDKHDSDDDTGGAVDDGNNKKTKKVVTVVRKTATGQIKRSSLKVKAPNLAALQKAAATSDSTTPTGGGAAGAAATATAADDDKKKKTQEKSVALSEARAAAKKKKMDQKTSNELLDDQGKLIGVSETWKNPFGDTSGPSATAKKKKAAAAVAGMKKKPPKTASSTTTTKTPTTTSATTTTTTTTTGLPPRRPGAQRTGPPDKKLSEASTGAGGRSPPPPPRRPGSKRTGPPDEKLSTESSSGSAVAVKKAPPPMRPGAKRGAVGAVAPPPKNLPETSTGASAGGRTPPPPKRTSKPTKPEPKPIARPKQQQQHTSLKEKDVPSSSTDKDDKVKKPIDKVTSTAEAEPVATVSTKTSGTEKVEEEMKSKKSVDDDKKEETPSSPKRHHHHHHHRKSHHRKDDDDEKPPSTITIKDEEPEQKISSPKPKFTGLSSLRKQQGDAAPVVSSSSNQEEEKRPLVMEETKPKMKFTGLSKLKQQQAAEEPKTPTTKKEAVADTSSTPAAKEESSKPLEQKLVPMKGPDEESTIPQTPGTPGRSKKIGKLAAMFESGNSSIPSGLNASISSIGKSPIPSYSRSSFVSPGGNNSSSRLPAVRPQSTPKKYTSMPRTWKPKPKLPQEEAEVTVTKDVSELPKNPPVEEPAPTPVKQEEIIKEEPASVVDEPVKAETIVSRTLSSDSNEDKADDNAYAPRTPRKSSRHLQLAAMFEKGNSSSSSFGKSPLRTRMPAVRPASSPKKYTSMPRTWKPKQSPPKVEKPVVKAVDDNTTEKQITETLPEPVESADTSKVEVPSQANKERSLSSGLIPETVIEAANETSSPVPSSPKPVVRPAATITVEKEEPPKAVAVPKVPVTVEKEEPKPVVLPSETATVEKELPQPAVISTETATAEKEQPEPAVIPTETATVEKEQPERAVVSRETVSVQKDEPKPSTMPPTAYSVQKDEPSYKEPMKSPTGKGISHIAKMFDKNPSPRRRSFSNPRQKYSPAAEEEGDGALMSMEEVEAMIKAASAPAPEPAPAPSPTPEPEAKADSAEEDKETNAVPPTATDAVDKPDPSRKSINKEEVDPIALLLDEFNEPDDVKPIGESRPGAKEDDHSESTATELRDDDRQKAAESASTSSYEMESSDDEGGGLAIAELEEKNAAVTSSYEVASLDDEKFEVDSSDDEKYEVASSEDEGDNKAKTESQEKTPEKEASDKEATEIEKPKPKIALQNAWSILNKGSGSSFSSDSSSSSGDSGASVDAGPTDDELEFDLDDDKPTKPKEVNEEKDSASQERNLQPQEDEKPAETGSSDNGGEDGSGDDYDGPESGEPALVLEFAIPGQDNRHVPVHVESMDDLSSVGSYGMIESDDSYDTRMNKMLKQLMKDKAITDEDDDDSDDDASGAEGKEKDAVDEGPKIKLDDNVLDHVILAGPDFEEAVKLFEETTGIAPTIVGQLQGLGVWSAQVIMDGNRYISILGPDPDPDAAGPIGDELVNLEWGQLTPYHYAIRSSEMSRLVEGYISDVLGWAPDNIAMVQSLPDDSVRKWDLLTMYGHEIGGAAPCYVKWKNPNRHPTAGTSHDVTLLYFVVAVPENHDVNKLVSEVDGITVEQDETPRMELYLETPKGMVDFSTEYPPGYAFPGFYDYYQSVPEMVEEEGGGDQERGYEAGEDAGGEGYDGEDYQGYYGEDGQWYQWDGEGGYYGEDGEYYAAEEGEGGGQEEYDEEKPTTVDDVVDELQNLIDEL